jgi:hypothetical protein
MQGQDYGEVADHTVLVITWCFVFCVTVTVTDSALLSEQQQQWRTKSGDTISFLD